MEKKTRTTRTVKTKKNTRKRQVNHDFYKDLQTGMMIEKEFDEIRYVFHKTRKLSHCVSFDPSIFTYLIDRKYHGPKNTPYQIVLVGNFNPHNINVPWTKKNFNISSMIKYAIIPGYPLLVKCPCQFHMSDRKQPILCEYPLTMGHLIKRAYDTLEKEMKKTKNKDSLEEIIQLKKDLDNTVEIIRRKIHDMLFDIGHAILCPNPRCINSNLPKIIDTNIRDLSKTEPFECDNCGTKWCPHCEDIHDIKDHKCSYKSRILKDLKSNDSERKNTAITTIKTCCFCPECHTPIQKTEGCDHMDCPNCNTAVCYSCAQVIVRPEPGMMSEHTIFTNEGIICRSARGQNLEEFRLAMRLENIHMALNREIPIEELAILISDNNEIEN